MSTRNSKVNYSVGRHISDGYPLSPCVVYVQGLALGSHSALIYADNMEKNWRVLKYVHSALTRGHAVLYLTKHGEKDYSKELMRIFGIKVPQYERRRQIRVLSSKEFYLERCEADMNEIRSRLTKSVDEARINGYYGLYVVGDMSCFLDEGLQDLLVDYELSLGKELPAGFAELCLYDSFHVSTLSEGFRAGLVKAHGSLVFPSDVVELAPADIGREDYALSLLHGKADCVSEETLFIHGRLIAMDRRRSYVIMEQTMGHERVPRRLSVKGWPEYSISELLIHLGEYLDAEVLDGKLVDYAVE